jgi:hypothetical protein
MAVDMSQASVSKIISDLYGTNSVAKKASVLMSSGAKLTFGLFQFKVEVAPDVVFTAQLPAMSTKIAGNALPTVQKELIAQKLAGVINQAYAAKFGTTDPDAMIPATGKTVATPEGDKGPKPSIAEVIKALKDVVDPVSQATGDLATGFVNVEPVGKAKVEVYGGGGGGGSGGTATVNNPKMPFMKSDPSAVAAQMYGATNGNAKPVDDVVALRDAKAIGQKVKGTSSSSVYNAVAIGPVNFAVKFTASNCSIRAESNEFTVAAKKKLKEAGFTDNGTYWSMHMKLNGVSAMRAIGAVLYSMDLPFQAVGTTTSQVVN